MPRLALLLLLLPAACGQLGSNPMQQPGTWAPTGANDANLRAMIANPADLDGRTTYPPSRAATSATAIDRLLAGKPKALSSESTSGGGGGGSEGGSGAGQ